MRPTALLSVLALAAGALLGIGCGSGGGTISRTDASALQDNLDQVSQAVSAGDCSAATAAVEHVRSQVRNLHGEIPVRLERNLQQGVAKLSGATPGDCADAAQQQTQTQTTDTTTTETTTTDTTPTETTTTDTTPTDTTTTPTETTTTPTDTTTAPTGGASPESTTTTTTPDAGSGGAQG